MTDDDRCYRALQTRDARFDGRFFTGVRTTGVYCRPVCPAPTPRRANCAFFPSAAAAQEAGFRPCLRCRPEAAPGSPAWFGTSATVARALRLIAEGALDDAPVAALAARLGVGERHLRRLFLGHLGAAPLAVAQTRRVLFAKRLLDETDLPMTDLALAAGFGSLRRFNEAMRRAWGRPPGELRRRRGAPAPDAPGLRLRLSFRPPLDWEGLLAFAAPRATPGVEVVAQGVWRRALALGPARGRVEVGLPRGARELEARVVLDRPAALGALAARLRRLFDLDADASGIGAHLAADPRLAARLGTGGAVRLLGAFDPFEGAVRAVLAQQVSVAAATAAAARLAARLGEPLDASLRVPGVSHLFPTPAVLAATPAETLGLPGTRARAVVALARAVAEGRLALDAAADPEALRADLRAIPGVGPWTAEVIALRALQEPDAFPAADLALRRAAGAASAPLAPAVLAAAAESWRPWRGYAAVLLWSAPAAAPVAA